MKLAQPAAHFTSVIFGIIWYISGPCETGLDPSGVVIGLGLSFIDTERRLKWLFITVNAKNACSANKIKKIIFNKLYLMRKFFFYGYTVLYSKS